ncbi:class I SAM-dependent methyltransferase [Methylobrevis pamukkalensis]|uniref:16S ribosomal RNA methyltransferase KsgA/Dim1 family protein n=1 Tax=Methylobrevis pamukkalensis TaxID=1439726 RepID=A0A1E3H039_9HYPH|nr:methyltransferase domain-containing protein [Methylobrevis pamukkalensis]ODN69652.1 16S ribosomal RNA methyltransferase KsgA/Dim1 family protein [Methylobrevis pamukkalensis]
MTEQVRCEARNLKTLVGDELRFFRNWVGQPLTTGAVSPSGRFLARAMAAPVDRASTGAVVELGPGTGAVTRALVQHGIAPARIRAVEFNPAFARLLGERFPDIEVIVGDAYALDRTLGSCSGLSAIVSSLPLFNKPPADRVRLVEQAMDLLAPGAPFIQFSYALVPPVPALEGKWTLERSRWILRNLPPARVWTYRAVA